MATATRTASSRSTFLSSTVNPASKENKPAWYGGCSPGRPNSYLRSNPMRPLGDHKLTGSAKTTTESGALKVEKHLVKKNPSPSRTVPTAATKVLKPSSPRLRPASPRLVAASNVAKEDVKKDTSLAPSKQGPKVAKAIVKNETPPPTRPKKPVSTPTNKSRKPLATLGTPTNQGTRDRSRCLDETPTRKVKERPASGAAQDTSKVKDKSQPFSSWAFSATKTRRGSTPGRGTTPSRAPVKSMFLSPQASRKNVKKEPLRKSAENHGIWVGQVPSRKRAAEKTEPDGGMPPAQPTNSPEIPKRGSRELSGEGARGYFGAGPMVAPEGCGGFVRDRRKCKPRGTLVVGDEGLSIDSDSSGVLETSMQMPLPSVASVEWMDRQGLMNSSSTSVPGYYSDANQPRGGIKVSQDLIGDEFQHQVKQARTSTGVKKQIRQSRQSADEYHQSRSHDIYGDSFYHQLKQARSSAGEGHKEVRQSGQSADGFYRSRTSLEVFGDGFYQQQKFARSGGGDAYRSVRQSRQSGEGFYQPIVRSSQVFLEQLRQSQLGNIAGMGQLCRQSTQSTHSECFKQNSQYSEGIMHNCLYSEGIMQNPQSSEGTLQNPLKVGNSEFSESAGYADVTIDWRDGLPDSQTSSAKQSPDECKTEEFVGGSISFSTSWVPPAQERRLSGGAKTWYAPDSTWYGFSPITPEFHRASQLPDGGSKLIDALVAGSVRRRIMTDQNSSDGDPDLPNKSLIQSFQVLNVDGSVNKSQQSRSPHSRSSRGSQEAPSLPFSFATRRSYANIAELEAEQSPESLDTCMCQTASPIEPLHSDDATCEGALPFHGNDLMCQTASALHGDSANCETASSSQGDDMICQTASPICEVCSAPVPSVEEGKWSGNENIQNRWDNAHDSEDGVEYASPVAGDYLSPVQHPTHCASPERSFLDMGCSESNRGMRASRRTSMSKTLEELMRHNLHI